MNLLFDTKKYKRLIGNDDQILYAVPCDLNTSMRYAEGMVIVTVSEIIVISDSIVSFRIPLCSAQGCRYENITGGGLLYVTEEDSEYLITACTMRHAARLHHVSVGINKLLQGNIASASSKEFDNLCPKCGSSLFGSFCPHCLDPFASYRKLIRLAAPYKKYVFIIFFLFLFISLFAAIEPYFYKLIINDVLIDGKVHLLAWLIGAIFFSQLLKQLSVIIRDRCSARFATGLLADLRNTLFDKVQLLSLGNINARKAGELFNRVSRDTNAVSNFISERFFSAASQLFTILVVLVFMLLSDWRLTVLAILPIPLILFAQIKYHAWMRQLFRKQHIMWDSVNTMLHDVFNGIRVIKAFGKEKSTMKKYADESRVLTDRICDNETQWSTVFPLLSFLMVVGQYFVLYAGGEYVLGGQLSLGTIMQFTTYLSMLYAPLGSLATLPREIAMTATSIERIFDILDEKPLIEESKEQHRALIRGQIELKNVSFGYHSYDPVLKNINMKVNAGEMIGLVGHSGSGKSTLINLIMHLYEPNEGEILVDSVPLSSFSKESFSSQLGVVLQETFLFSGSVADNIRFAKPDASMAEVINAAKIANAHDFIVSFPNGYDTYVGEHGYNLSGGERQRIAIARAVLHDPQILILDEATSSLDTDTEQSIQEALSRLIKGRTTFAIAHRLSTLKNADRLYVLEKGQIAEFGTHDELMRKKGIYFSLVLSQRTLTKMSSDPIS